MRLPRHPERGFPIHPTLPPCSHGGMKRDLKREGIGGREGQRSARPAKRAQPGAQAHTQVRACTHGEDVGAVRVVLVVMVGASRTDGGLRVPRSSPHPVRGAARVHWQVFEIKPSKLYRCDAQATGKLKLGLTLSVPAAGPFSIPATNTHPR
jgi:hypothetical protein